MVAEGCGVWGRHRCGEGVGPPSVWGVGPPSVWGGCGECGECGRSLLYRGFQINKPQTIYVGAIRESPLHNNAIIFSMAASPSSHTSPSPPLPLSPSPPLHSTSSNTISTASSAISSGDPASAELVSTITLISRSGK